MIHFYTSQIPSPLMGEGKDGGKKIKVASSFIEDD